MLIGLGRLPFESIDTLRRLNGLPGHPDIDTPGIFANTGSLGMGISKAKGFVQANRLQGRKGEVYVLTGDGELQEGQFWESLPGAVNHGLHEITVIIDHNKVQSDTLVERVSSLGDLVGKLRAYGWAVDRCDGHDLNDLKRALAAVRAERGKPKIIVADTIKGRGVSFAEHTAMAPTDRLYKFHSGAPAPDVHERMAAELVATANRLLLEVEQPALILEHVPFPERPAAGTVQRMVPAYSKALLEAAANDPTIVALDADLVLDTGLLEFEERFTDRFIECGIAEQDMVSQASGLALAGMLPVCHSFACFLSTRPERADLQPGDRAHEGGVCRVVGGAGAGRPGPLAPVRARHCHVGVCARADSDRAVVRGRDRAGDDVRADRGAALGLFAVGLDPLHDPVPVARRVRLRGRARRGADGGFRRRVDRVRPGAVAQAVEAARLLGERGIGLKVVNLPWLNRIDSEWLRQTVDGYPLLVTLDNHYVWGGQGEYLLSQVSRLGLVNPPRGLPLGVRSIPACGTNDEVLQYHGLDAGSIADTIASSLGRRV